MPKTFRSSYSVDWLSFIVTCIIASIGLLFIFSATYTAQCPYSIFFKKQIIGIILGIIVYWCFVWIDYRTLLRTGYFAYFAVIGLLLFTLIKGSIGMGGQRWLNLFFFKLQPSELAKPLLPAFIAYYFFTHRNPNKYTLRDFWPLLATVAISFILIAKQPDLGTAIIVACSGLLLMWLAGMPKKFFILGFLMSIICAPIFWHLLKPYQRNRITVFFGYGTTHKERYQIEQAAIAIGSGGFMGKGLLKGTQNQLQFLPESRTDFIFAVLCEEWGFFGACIVLSLYIFLFIRIFYIIRLIETRYMQLLAVGLLIHLVLSTIINIFMVIGFLPIVGIPLPLMSYGLANLLISFASLGWIQGIYIQEQ
jgi:rod shape determining protein RodA